MQPEKPWKAIKNTCQNHLSMSPAGVKWGACDSICWRSSAFKARWVAWGARTLRPSSHGFLYYNMTFVCICQQKLATVYGYERIWKENMKASPQAMKTRHNNTSKITLCQSHPPHPPNSCCLITWRSWNLASRRSSRHSGAASSTCVRVSVSLSTTHWDVCMATWPKSTRSWNSLGQIDALYITVSWTWSGSWTPECVQSPKRWFLETWSALVTAVTVPVTFLCIMMYQQAISIDFPFRPPLLLVAPAGRRKARIRYRNTTPTNWSTHFVQHPSSATNACSGFILFLPEIWVLEYIYNI